MRRGTGRFSLLAGLLLVCPTLARAHEPFEITADAHVSGDQLAVHTTSALQTAARACLEGADAERRLAPADFEALKGSFEACARDYYVVSAGGEPLPLRWANVRLSVENDVEMRIGLARPARSPLVFEAQRLRRLAPLAGIVLTVTGERTFLGQQLLRPDAAVFELPITSDAEAPGTPPLPSFGRYLLLGVEHILTGADHLLFLLGLLLVCRRIRNVAVIVTSFTLAHSITLSLAALDRVALSGRIVEPLIAASIVLVGVENLRRGSEPEGPWLERWLLAFAFGLLHGLGFASALRESGLGAYGTSVVPPLIAFNLGIELGQLAIAAAVLALWWRVPRGGRWAQLPRAVSVAIAGIGCLWLASAGDPPALPGRQPKFDISGSF